MDGSMAIGAEDSEILQAGGDWLQRFGERTPMMNLAHVSRQARVPNLCHKAARLALQPSVERAR